MQPATLTKKLIYRGDTEHMGLTFTNTDDDSPYDLTAWADIKMDVRIQPNELSHRVMELTIANGGLEITGDGNNKLVLHLTPERTISFNKGALYYYDIRFYDLEGNVLTLLKGEIQSTYNITK